MLVGAFARELYAQPMPRTSAATELYIYQRVQDYVWENGMTLDDLLAQIYFDPESTAQERLDAARFLGEALSMN